MRKYATVSATVWQGDIKKLKGDLEAIAVYYNLTTNASATMIGIYVLPITYLAYDLGSPIEAASEGLRRVIEAGLCSYDDEHEIVWVHNMAASQIAPRLKPTDKKVPGAAKQLSTLPICLITMEFYRKYREPFNLFDQPWLAEFEREFQSEQQAPSKPLPSKEQEQVQVQEQSALEKEDLNKREIEKSFPQKQTTTFSTDSAARSSSKASDFSKYEEPYDPEPNPEAGRAKLQELRVPAQFIEPALHRLMAGQLVNSDLERWRAQARGAAAA